MHDRSEPENVRQTSLGQQKNTDNFLKASTLLLPLELSNENSCCQAKPEELIAKDLQLAITSYTSDQYNFEENFSGLDLQGKCFL